jgi:DNA-binding response OmpR family regulator
MTDSHSKSKSNHHILIVDDDNEHRRLLGLMLADEGYTISHAINGQQAISLHRSRPCDLVITELTVGGRDSFQTILELRRHPTPPKFIATARTGCCRRISACAWLNTSARIASWPNRISRNKCSKPCATR